MTDRLSVEKLAEEIGSEQGRLDVLVSNAYAGCPGRLEASLAEDFRAAYEVSVVAAFGLIQMTRPLLATAAKSNSGGSSVILVSSMYGVVSPDPRIYGSSGLDSPPYYGPAKAALAQLGRHLACHLAPERIRVNVVRPGAFPPAGIKDRAPDFHQKLCQKSPLGRIGLPHELQGALALLASDAGSYITGAEIAVDGGWTAW